MQQLLKHTRLVSGALLAAALIVGWVPAAGATPSTQQDACGGAATLIHAIQGAGEDISPLAAEKVTVEAVVVGDYQDRMNELGGFFIQEEDSDADDDSQSSEGVFVAENRRDVAVGDVVRLTGTVFESSDDGAYLTTIRRVTELAVCDSGAAVSPAEVVFPVEALIDLEAYEGMLITIPQEMTVSENYNLGRYGELLLAANGRLVQPTNIVRPGVAADALLEEYTRRSIMFDDGNSQQNHDPILTLAQDLSAAQTVRAGYVVTNVTGVLDTRLGGYRLQLTEPLSFMPVNYRTVAPEDVGGALRVASFNVLNYFNGDGEGGGFPTPRGANNAFELERQQAKLVSAILAMDADVIGLIEIENDGDGPNSAVATLVAALNDASGAETYAAIADPPDWQLPADGADVIKVTLIYRPAAVSPVGVSLADYDPVHSRPPVAQTFEDVISGERFSVIVNHFKSKGCTDADGANLDQGDGQGCYNAQRIAQAEALATFVAEIQALSGDDDVLIIGDLNSYAMEDPMMVLADAGMVNLVDLFVPNPYSYVYFGMAGYLDHAWATPELVAQVSGATIWHINADEPRVLDYNEEYKTPGQVEQFYSPDMFRSSDHDPVVIGLAPGPVAASATE